MASHTHRVVLYLDDPTRREIARLADVANLPVGVYARKLVEQQIAGGTVSGQLILTTVEKVWIAVDAILKTQTWDPALRGTVREIIERRAGRLDA